MDSSTLVKQLYTLHLHEAYFIVMFIKFVHVETNNGSYAGVEIEIKIESPSSNVDKLSAILTELPGG